jgi:sugar phosphate isomerase/epimerase
MQLSCLPVSFFSDIIEGRMRLGEWARLARELALDAVDLSILFIPDRSPAAVAAARRQIEDEGMRVLMLTTYPDFTHPDPRQRARELALAHETMEVAEGLGARYVRVTAGQAHPGVRREEGIAWAVEGLTRLVETTGANGPIPVYENHAANQRISESASQRVSESANQRVSESASQRVSESASQRISESANQRVSESANR